MKLSFKAYTNANWVGLGVDWRSTLGYCTLLGENLVSKIIKKQRPMARSSVKVEFKAITWGICEFFWLRIVLDNLKVKWEGTMNLHCDNKLAINIAHSPI